MAISPAKIHLFNLFVKICPPSRCNGLKVRLLSWAGVKVGNNVSIFTPKILGQFDLIIGDNCWIGHEALIFGAVGSKIEMKPYSKYNRQNEKYEFYKRKVQEETFEYSLNEVRTSLFHSVILYPFERSHIEFKQDIFTTFN